MYAWILWTIALGIAVVGMAVAWIGLAHETRRVDIRPDLGELEPGDE